MLFRSAPSRWVRRWEARKVRWSIRVTLQRIDWRGHSMASRGRALTPAQLKSAGLNGAAALSRAWKVKKQHRGVYTGGKWQVVPALPASLKEALGSPAERQHRLLDGLLFSLCDGDVSVAGPHGRAYSHAAGALRPVEARRCGRWQRCTRRLIFRV